MSGKTEEQALIKLNQKLVSVVERSGGKNSLKYSRI
jgi:hypothetical protein